MQDRTGHPLRIRPLIVSGLILALSVAGIIFGVTNIDHASATTTPIVTQHAPLDLSGHWKQIKSGIAGAVMDATIKNDEIQINVTMTANDISGLYWTGSFDTGGSNLSPFSVTSVGDTKAMDEAMFGSQDSSKVFYYNNGVLSFPYSMMGVSTTVQLSRS